MKCNNTHVFQLTIPGRERHTYLFGTDYCCVVGIKSLSIWSPPSIPQAVLSWSRVVHFIVQHDCIAFNDLLQSTTRHTRNREYFAMQYGKPLRILCGWTSILGIKAFLCSTYSTLARAATITILDAMAVAQPSHSYAGRLRKSD